MTNPSVEAVILAAGRGLRLGSRGELTPKGLLSIGGECLVPRLCEQLIVAGIERLVIVTGHHDTQYRSALAGIEQVEFVHNPAYADSGSLQSLACARPTAGSDVLIVESDLLMESRGISAMLGGAGNAVLGSDPTGSGDEVFVFTQGSHLDVLTKDATVRAAPPFAEYAGIARLTSNGFSVAIGPALRKVSGAMEYEEGINALAKLVPVDVRLVSDLVWTEVDTPEHLKRAIEVIAPRITEESTACERPERPRPQKGSQAPLGNRYRLDISALFQESSTAANEASWIESAIHPIQRIEHHTIGNMERTGRSVSTIEVNASAIRASVYRALPS